MIRAIYIGDIKYDNSPVFKYNESTNKFHMIGDEEYAYDYVVVMNDRDWIVFTIGGESVTMLDTPRRMTDDEIANAIIKT